jgi:hypothetical protein
MLACRAASTIERISNFTIPVAGALRESAVLFVALPLALSNPIPAPEEGAWTVQSASLHSSPSMSVIIDEATVLEPDEPATASLVPLPPSETASAVTPVEVTPVEVKEVVSTAAAPEIEPVAAVVVEIAPQKKRTAGMMDEVDAYLWEVYRRSPTKRDSAGDFTWKDPVAAERFGVSMPAYVIGGMDPDFREQLYHAGRAMDAAGIRWSILSAFRDDYRQSIASGFKARTGNSLHGGSARTGGYGHGQAVDVTTEDGHGDAVWRWIDRNGEKFGLHRPMPGADPPHIQPRGSWHDLALALRHARLETAEQAQAQGTRLANADDAAEAAW